MPSVRPRKIGIRHGGLQNAFMNSPITHSPTDPSPAGRSLAHGNRFQRAYYRWARPHYERIGRDDPALGAEIEAIDQWLYSGKSRAAWVVWTLGLAVLVGGLHRMGMAWLVALLLGCLLYVGLTIVLAAAWLSPNAHRSAQTGPLPPVTVRFLWGLVVGGVAAVLGLITGSWLKKGTVDWPGLMVLAEKSALTILLLAGGLSVLVAVVAWAGRVARARRLQQLTLVAERDAARALAAEAELRVLQAQIQPHFVFNTLATLQHWVDRGDPRAAPLLRELTGFLRRSTEMLGRHQVPLHEEAQAVCHYLAILQARWESRLAYVVDISSDCADLLFPPGLLLTLVENAVVHGIEPALHGGRIEVRAERTADGWCLWVDNTGHGLAPGASAGVGLANARLRLQQHFGAAVQLTLEQTPEGVTRAAIRSGAQP